MFHREATSFSKRIPGHRIPGYDERRAVMTTIRSSGDSSSIESNVATSGRVRDTWVLGKRELVELAAFWLGFVAIGWAVGEWVLGPGSDTAVTRFDTDVAEWFVDRRTPALNDWSHLSSMLADTLVKVVVS